MQEFLITENNQVRKEKISVWDCLKKHYPDGQYALMQEVSNKAGFDRSRSADFIVMGLWPSRGLNLEVIELKSFRGDWLGELKKPEKQESFFKHADYFWLLTTDETIAKIEEIPSTWGWMVIKGKGIKVIKQAPKLNPVAIDNSLLAALLKRASSKSGFVHEDTIEEEIEKRVEAKKDYTQRHYESLKEDYQTIRQQINRFQQASGVDINGWHGVERIGNAVRIICNGELDDYIKELKRLQSSAEGITKRLCSDIEMLEKTFKGEKINDNELR